MPTKQPTERLFAYPCVIVSNERFYVFDEKPARVKANQTNASSYLTRTERAPTDVPLKKNRSSLAMVLFVKLNVKKPSISPLFGVF